MNAAAAELRQFRKSTYSGQNGSCVEVATAPGWVGVRDSKLGVDSPVLVISALEWRALITRLRG
ncbi:DUF397 domain-containing protein [Pseudonocardia spinosispora]|uniref:DUF397 domain-containing protein n=1 Tax=Pseudonocardia spinosispora TaxID=103441 RepID=UPI000421B0C7|nr:DUF397 domain-containing protein [Pseudonocardia spinosispora]